MKRNWPKYNQTLINRGSITFWFSEDSTQNWIPQQKKVKGRPQKFSDQAILSFCILRFVFSLSLRTTQGFLTSLLQLLKLQLPTPSYSRVCRRMKSLDLSAYCSKRRPTDIVFDSTGLKVFGEGEWKVFKHGKGKRKIWRKLHVAICPNSGEIIVGKLTDVSEADCELLPRMLNECPRTVKRAYGDGAYDTMECRKALQARGIEEIIPPRKNAKPHGLPQTTSRDDAIFIIAGLGGNEVAKGIWKKASGYHKRSLVETSISSWKRVFGDKLCHRNFESQHSEVSIKTFIFNKMKQAGV